jgi:signal transduction histidine kinase
MKKHWIGLFEAPVYPENFEKTRIARLMNTFVLLSVFICVLALCVGVPFFFSHKIISAVLVSFFLSLSLISWFMLRQEKVSTAAAFLIVSVHLIVIANTIANGGIESKDNLFFVAPVVLSPLLLNSRWAFVSTLCAMIELGVFAGLGWWGVQIPQYMPGTPTGVGFLGLLILSLLYQAVRISVKGWTEALDMAHQELEERRRTEKERDGLRSQLFQSHKIESLGRMAGSIAHDFNNLLMVMTSQIDEIKSKYPGDEIILKELTPVEKALQSAHGMTQSLLNFSKIRGLRPERIEMDSWIREAQPVLSRLLGDKARLQIELNASNAVIMADKVGMTQLIQNLVVNAGESMTKNGLLIIRSKVVTKKDVFPGARSRKYYLLLFRDNGCGINKETQEKMFEPYFTTKEKGTGFGLATVLGIVNQHGGFIEVDSEPGEGTEFRVFIPEA